MDTVPQVTPTEVIISTLDDLSKFTNRLNLFPGKRRNIKVDISDLSEEENLRLTNEANEFRGACGCAQGRVAGIIVLVLYVAMVTSGVISIYKLGILKTIALYFAWATVGMVLGKIIGIWRARKKLKKIVDNLIVNLNPKDHGKAM